MSYARGMLDKRVEILNRGEARFNDFGKTGANYEPVKTVWAGCTWTKGVKAMREGALDAYDTCMVRCDWHEELTRQSRLRWDGKTYQIVSLNGDKGLNEMQVTCQEIVK